MYHPYTIKLDGGKYTLVNNNGLLDIQRYGEPWPAAEDLKLCNLVLAMAQRIEELEVATKAVLDGRLLENGCRANDSMTYALDARTPAASPELRRWENALRNVLEQKP